MKAAAVLLVAMLSIGAALAAAAEPSPTNTVSIQAAIDRAVANSAEIASLQSAVLEARQWVLAARDARDPELRLGYGQGQGSEDRLRTGTEEQSTLLQSTDSSQGHLEDQSDSYRVGLRVFPGNPWERSAKVNARTAELHAAEAALASAIWQLGVNVRRLAAEVDYLDRDATLLRDAIALRSSMLKSVRESSERGQGTLADMATASRRYIDSVSDRNASSRKRSERLRELASLLNLPAEGLVVQMDAVPTASNLLQNAEVLEQRAWKSRADLQVMRWKTAAARAACDETKATRIPWLRQVDASYAWGSQDTTGTQDGSELAVLDGRLRSFRTTYDDHSMDSEWRIEAAFNIPIFSWFNHEADAQLAAFRKASMEENEAVKKAARELRDALAAVRDIQGEWAQYLKDTEPVIQELRKAIAGVDANAAITAVELADMKLQIVDASRARLRTAYDYRQALISLEEVLGIPLRAAQ